MYFNDLEPVSQETFDSLVLESVDDMNACIARVSSRQCAWLWRNYGTNARRLRMELGMYVEFLEVWLSFFPKDSIKVVESEQLNDLNVFDDILKHIGVNPALKPRASVNVDKANMGYRRMQQGEMFSSTRRVLTDFYQPYNQRLATLLDDTRFLWE
jgi:hypothetical protein